MPAAPHGPAIATAALKPSLPADELYTIHDTYGPLKTLYPGGTYPVAFKNDGQIIGTAWKFRLFPSNHNSITQDCLHAFFARRRHRTRRTTGAFSDAGEIIDTATLTDGGTPSALSRERDNGKRMVVQVASFSLGF